MITAEQLQELRAELERIERKLGELIASATDSVTHSYTYQDEQGVEHSDSMTLRAPAPPLLPEGWEWVDGAAMRQRLDWRGKPETMMVVEIHDGRLVVDDYDAHDAISSSGVPLEVVRAVLKRFGGGGDAQT